MALSSRTRMVADVGGTNTRIALFDPASQQFRALSSYINRDYQQFEDVIAHWLECLSEPAPANCCIAVAAPPSGDRVRMVNMNWSFSSSEVATRFNFTKLRRLNDFESNAYALPHLEGSDQQLLYPGNSEPLSRLATVGPGTGLGGAVLDRSGVAPTSHACEPGHMGLSAGTELELELFRVLLPRHGDIYAELLVSGPGLKRLYQCLAQVKGEPADSFTPEQISARALAGTDPLCMLALNTFCALLGSVCGDFLLANGAYGGLYLAGGIIPGMIPYLQRSSFRERLIGKGAMRDQLSSIPVYVITASYPGLIGAAHAPLV